ncbi:hypothetical protein OK074_6381 [Actinobacteria bacterium OK074]|nr:hypothetical protein OK074_6381 [Actinobacteria bacterium OK074]
MTAVPHPPHPRAAVRAIAAPFAGEGAPWRAAAALMLLATLGAQHPSRLFGRTRRGSWGTMPNWKFFAPSPATHDYHVLYRTLDAEDTTSPWHPLDVGADRTPSQLVWFPTRRSGKALFDLVAEIRSVLDLGFTAATRTPAYVILVERVRAVLDEQGRTPPYVQGFQLAIARAPGHDLRNEPEVMAVFPYTPLDPHARTGTAA